VNFRLASILLLGFSIHISTFASRTATPLIALQNGHSAATVGVLLSTYWIVPIVFAISAGRWVDRVGARRPMLVSSALQVAGLVTAALWPALPGMAAAAVLIGSAHILGVIALNNATGALGGSAARGSAFVWLTMSFSAGVMSGPLIAGFALEHGGQRAPYAFAALLVAAIGAFLFSRRTLIPDTRVAHAARAGGHVTALLREPVLRRVLMISVVGPLSWELYYVFMPLHGTAIGLTPSAIGTVMSLFAVAVIVVRIVSPVLQRRVAPWPLLAGCFGCAAFALAAFPFADGAVALGAASFAFGLCMGLSAPLQMFLAYEATPEGRKGEVTGLRQTLFNVIATLAPTTIAALSTAIGFGPVVWTTAAALAAASHFARTTGKLARALKASGR
jgi:MFS family permease